MKYFVLALYEDEKWWHHLPQPFYSKSATVAFDDILSLMSMYEENNAHCQLLHLSYHPHMRTLLHRFDLYEANVWSLFDEIQGFNAGLSRSLQFEDLEWPDETELIYTPYFIQAIVGQAMSKVYFNQDGYLIRIDDFEEAQCVRRYIFDDRGYLSAIRYYTNGVAEIQDYLTVTGQVILREHLSSGRVDVSASFEHLFDARTYDTMVALIKERFHKYCQRHFKKGDQCMVGSNLFHNTLFKDIHTDVTVSYSIFSKRNTVVDDALLDSMAHSSKWIVDTHENERDLNALLADREDAPDILRMTPFNTQPLSNLSSQLNETYIGFWIDNLERHEIEQVLNHLTAYLWQNLSYRLVILTHKGQAQIEPWLIQWQDEMNEMYQQSQRIEDEATAELMRAEESGKGEGWIQIQSVPFEDEVMKALARLRIVIDLGAEPDLYIQIASISVRIPQVHASQSHYVTHLENGYVIEDYDGLQVALDYFLSTLKHWNSAYTFNTSKIEQLSSRRIVQRLNEFLEGDTHGTSV
ncbi:accessory Sec system protein Asp1 [Staphylococcus lutrae]|uniref:Accessory Sec system protein Asp1 n=1 Tax=Staphylococcus lutrae TaxID=155085 RepID=A0AAC9RR92_9STAP|nr:accessory Sec system protein Asp1 [Staphylococcus lutrae]ARJ50848.1 accessory Sec system protein Asp1 [Staphylococcus lutrae]PNZ39694.1 accessory Sec system protein Asp1 [Staphylococcus lutrae]